MSDVQPERGDHVTYIDQHGDEKYGIVLEPLPEDDYVTVAWAQRNPDEHYIGPEWTVETSVHPHKSLGERYYEARYAFTPGWPET